MNHLLDWDKFTPNTQKDKAERRKRIREAQRAEKIRRKKLVNPRSFGLVNYVSTIEDDRYEDSPPLTFQLRRRDVKNMIDPETGECCPDESPAICCLEPWDEEDFAFCLDDGTKRTLQEHFDEWTELEALSIWEEDIDHEFNVTLKQLQRIGWMTGDMTYYHKASGCYAEIYHKHSERIGIIRDRYKLIAICASGFLSLR